MSNTVYIPKHASSSSSLMKRGQEVQIGEPLPLDVNESFAGKVKVASCSGGKHDARIDTYGWLTVGEFGQGDPFGLRK